MKKSNTPRSGCEKVWISGASAELEVNESANASSLPASALSAWAAAGRSVTACRVRSAVAPRRLAPNDCVESDWYEERSRYEGVSAAVAACAAHGLMPTAMAAPASPPVASRFRRVTPRPWGDRCGKADAFGQREPRLSRH